jgi:AraC-like DNA-binding protein
MVSNRCIIAVKSELLKLGLHWVIVELGEVEIVEDLTTIELQHIKEDLDLIGLELMEDKKSILIEKIKIIIIDMVHHSDGHMKTNFSDYLGAKLGHSYAYLAHLFSDDQGMTIEHFIISHKIEKIKELIMYDEMNITEIADLLHYSSVAHLSNQFKKETGLSPLKFKNAAVRERLPLEEVGRAGFQILAIK